MKKVLFFSPYADVWVHSLPEAEIAEALRDNGWSIDRITCQQDFSEHCVAMAAKGIEFSADAKTKSGVCTSCVYRQSLLQKSFKFKDETIGSLLATEQTLEIIDIMDGISISNWMEFELGGVPLGKMAFYDFSLTNKLNSVDISEHLWEAYKNDLQNSIKTYFAVNNLMSEKKFDVLITYNGMYATNNVAGYVARQHGCSTWSLHAGQHLVDRFGTMYMYESTTLPVFAHESREWQEARLLPVPSNAAAKVTDHLLELFQASNRFVYSSPLADLDIDAVRATLGILPNRKVLLATMSSADEIFGAKMAGVLKDGKIAPLFENGFEWISYLVEQIKDRQDLHLIIRVHPREFPNKRESTLSENAKNLRELLLDLPINVSVNWPEQKISLYGLAHIVDVVLNASSSAGIEMSALGLPVVLHRVEHMLAYDPYMHPRVEDKNLYLTAVDDALGRGWSVDNMRSAYRWWAFVFTRVAVDISEGFTYPSAGYISASNDSKARLKNKILTMAVKYGLSIQERSHLLRRKKLRNGPLFSAALEGDSHVLLAPRLDVPTEKKSEDQVLAREAKRLLQVLRTSYTENSPLVQNFKQFVADN
jgi:hypothetical protein